MNVDDGVIFGAKSINMAHSAIIHGAFTKVIYRGNNMIIGIAYADVYPQGVGYLCPEGNPCVMTQYLKQTPSSSLLDN